MHRRLWLMLVLAFGCSDSVSSPNEDDEPVVDDDSSPLVSVIVDGSRVLGADGAILLAADPLTNPEDATYTWSFGDATSATGVSVSHTYAQPGCYSVTLTVSRGDTTPATATTQVHSVATLDATQDTATLPVAHGFVPRSDMSAMTHTGYVQGTLGTAGWTEVRVRVTQADGAVVHDAKSSVCGAATFDVTYTVPVALQQYDIAVSALSGDAESALASTTDVVFGDVIVIQGQSNAVSANYSSPAPVLGTNDFIRSWGSSTTAEATSIADSAWHLARQNSNASGGIGQWGMRFALDLVAATNVPLAVMNGADGGKRIDFFQRNDANPLDTTKNYGRFLRRMRGAEIDHAVRAVIFYQGESDQGAGDTHRTGFTTLYDDWHDDFPTIERVYTTQVRHCSDEKASLPVQEVQRAFQNAGGLAHTTTMSVQGIDNHDGCHYRYVNGYETLAHTYSALLLRDLYGVSARDLEAIDVTTATLSGNTITIGTKGDYTSLTIETGTVDHLWDHMEVVADAPRAIVGVTLVGTDLVVQLDTATGTPRRIRYWGHRGAAANPPPSRTSVVNAKGVGLLAFDLSVTP